MLLRKVRMRLFTLRALKLVWDTRWSIVVKKLVFRSIAPWIPRPPFHEILAPLFLMRVGRHPNTCEVSDFLARSCYSFRSDNLSNLYRHNMFTKYHLEIPSVRTCTYSPSSGILRREDCASDIMLVCLEGVRLALYHTQTRSKVWKTEGRGQTETRRKHFLDREIMKQISASYQRTGNQEGHIAKAGYETIRRTRFIYCWLINFRKFSIKSMP